MTERVKLLEANEFINKLNDNGESGYNIFEYCFFYKNKNRNKCRSFVYLLDSFLKCVKSDVQWLSDSDFIGNY